MTSINRRAVLKAASAGAVVAGTALFNGHVDGDEPKPAKLWTLEGELKVHPKYLYRYFLVLGNGQQCGLYGSDHGREPALLTRLQLPVRVRVQGLLGTEHHTGGTKENLSPFPETWFLYMDVHEVQLLK